MNDDVKIEFDHLTDPLAKPLVLTDGWESYEVTSDMMSGADTFTINLTPRKELLDWFRRTGHTVRIYVGSGLQLMGIVDAAPLHASSGGLQLSVTGRDYGGLLVDAAAPMITYNNISLRTIVERLIAPFGEFITEVETNYAATRYKVAGYSQDYIESLEARTLDPKTQAHLKKAIRTNRKVGKNSPFYAGVDTDRSFAWRTKPGEKIWERIEWLSKQIGSHPWVMYNKMYLARPLYSQEPSYNFYVHIDDDANVVGSNCTISHQVDIGDRFATYAVTGQGTPKANSLGIDLAEKYAAAIDPTRAFWITDGGAQMPRIPLTEVISVTNVSDKKHVRRIARTRMEEAAIASAELTIDIPGHKQTEDGPNFAIDTTADVDFQPRGIHAPYYIRRRIFYNDGNSGKRTQLGAVPCNVWLAYDHDSLDDQSYTSAIYQTWEEYAI